jgi:hypothetical protein
MGYVADSVEQIVGIYATQTKYIYFVNRME